jgi:hypothetical protein
MGDFHSVDDELFAIDYRTECQASALITPEPSTVRLEERTPRTAPPERVGSAPPAPAGYPGLVIAFAGVLVLVLVSFGVVLWWWTG